MVIPIFLPHLGCRDRCTYCHQGYITDVSGEDIKARIDAAFIHRAAPCDVGLFGGNIFGIEPAVLEKMFSFFEPYRDWVRAFRLSTKPVPLRDETIYLLKENKTDIIELGIPTFNDAILAGLNRAHTARDLFLAYDRLSGEGFRLALQFMVGLPGESQGDIEETVANMIGLRPVYIRIYPLVVLRNTPLFALYCRGDFVPVSFDEALDRACLIYLKAMKHNIDIVNVGLTDNEMVRDMVAGGFYHPAYGFLVQSRIFLRAVEGVLKRLDRPKEITVILHNNDIPLLVGHRRENLSRFAAMGLTLRWEPSGQRRGAFEVVSGTQRVEGSVSAD
ncbi:MAG TPA: radical SAM protein [Syntrophorhabdaceae bacterium]|nr:radical SAM protein [Syntrophorhabdaceae bacterium]